MAFVLYISISCNDSSSVYCATIPKMLANSSPASTPSQLELSIPLCSSKTPTLGESGGAVQERLVRRSGHRPNYTNLVHERLHYRLGSQVYTHLNVIAIHIALTAPGPSTIMCHTATYFGLSLQMDTHGGTL
jgi:hypothetical protein